MLIVPLKYILVISSVLCAVYTCQLPMEPDAEGHTSFYTAQKVEDLWRVPLLEPFEVISTNNADDWFFIWESPNITASDFVEHEGDFQLTNIQKVGILDSVLVLEIDQHYWPLLGGDFPSVLVIDVKTMQGYFYSKDHHEDALSLKMRELGIEAVEMLNWEALKNTFQESGELPTAWSHVK